MRPPDLSILAFCDESSAFDSARFGSVHALRSQPLARARCSMSSLSLVPLADPAADLARHREAILAAIGGVIDRGAYILGPEVARFEELMAERLGVPGAVGVAS